jgi:hypothetical protein
MREQVEGFVPPETTATASAVDVEQLRKELLNVIDLLNR